MKKMTYDGEKCSIESGLVNPPMREVCKQIRMEIGTLIRSERETDGVIRDENALYELACLVKALRILVHVVPWNNEQIKDLRSSLDVITRDRDGWHETVVDMLRKAKETE